MILLPDGICIYQTRLIHSIPCSRPLPGYKSTQVDLTLVSVAKQYTSSPTVAEKEPIVLLTITIPDVEMLAPYLFTVNYVLMYLPDDTNINMVQ